MIFSDPCNLFSLSFVSFEACVMLLIRPHILTCFTEPFFFSVLCCFPFTRLRHVLSFPICRGLDGAVAGNPVGKY